MEEILAITEHEERLRRLHLLTDYELYKFMDRLGFFPNINKIPRNADPDLFTKEGWDYLLKQHSTKGDEFKAYWFKNHQSKRQNQNDREDQKQQTSVEQTETPVKSEAKTEKLSKENEQVQSFGGQTLKEASGRHKDVNVREVAASTTAEVERGNDDTLSEQIDEHKDTSKEEESLKALKQSQVNQQVGSDPNMDRYLERMEEWRRKREAQSQGTVDPRMLTLNLEGSLNQVQQSHLSGHSDSVQGASASRSLTYQLGGISGAPVVLHPYHQSHFTGQGDSSQSFLSSHSPRFQQSQTTGTPYSWKPSQQSQISGIANLGQGVSTYELPTLQHERTSGTSTFYNPSGQSHINRPSDYDPDKPSSTFPPLRNRSKSISPDYERFVDTSPEKKKSQSATSKPSKGYIQPEQSQVKKRKGPNPDIGELNPPLKKPRTKKNTKTISKADNVQTQSQINKKSSPKGGEGSSSRKLLKDLAHQKDLAITPPINPEGLKSNQEDEQPESETEDEPLSKTRKKGNLTRRPPKIHDITVDPYQDITGANLIDKPDKLVKLLHEQIKDLRWRNKQGYKIKVPERKDLRGIAKKKKDQSLFNTRGYIKAGHTDILNKYSYKGLGDGKKNMDPELWEYLSRAKHENHLKDPSHYRAKDGKPRIRKRPQVTQSRKKDGTFSSSDLDVTRAFDVTYLSEQQLAQNMNALIYAYTTKVKNDTTTKRRMGSDQKEMVRTFKEVVDHFVRIKAESQTISNCHSHLMKECNRIDTHWRRIHEDQNNWADAVKYAAARSMPIPPKPDFKVPTGVSIPREHRKYYKKVTQETGVTVNEDPANPAEDEDDPEEEDNTNDLARLLDSPTESENSDNET